MSQDCLLGIDTGGTFTDFILVEGGKIKLHKVLSTPDAPEKAIIQGIEDLGLSNKLGQLRIIHGTTVATNAALENKGVKTAFITNRGFADMLTIGRQARDELYNLQPAVLPPPVPEELCLETGGRMDAQGNTITPLAEQDLDQLEEQIRQQQPDAIAINLLFSFLNDADERRIEQRLSNLAYCCRSSAVLPEMREYERGIATWYNAYLGPLVANYFTRLQQAVSPAPVAIMQSSGGTIALNQAADRAVNLLLSGPAGGLAAAAYMGKLGRSEKIMTFDMGGTSTDVAMINGRIGLTSEGRIGRYPVAVPMVDMHTIGAGGGSIAYLDAAGMLHVGPQSAGASPGPACYGQGGTQPTVTDANAVLGRLQPDNFLGGSMTLDKQQARDTIAKLAKQLGLNVEECAMGVIDLANEHMTQALRVISEQRGHDPSEYQLVGFGGAGGLHICALAEAIGIKHAMVPIYGGVFSAFGMLVAPPSRELSHGYLRSFAQLCDEEVKEQFSSLRVQAVDSLTAEGIAESDMTFNYSVDCRYSGQSFTLNIDWQSRVETEAAFHLAHESTYGHRFNLSVEVVNLRLSAHAKAANIELEAMDLYTDQTTDSLRPIWIENDKGQVEERMVPIHLREQLSAGEWLDGPVLICEKSATTWIEPHWRVRLDNYGNLELEQVDRF